MLENFVLASEYGLAVFDPKTLDDYLHANKIVEKNLYKVFTTSGAGEEVLDKGIVFPIYPINIHDYKIVVSSSNSNADSDLVFSKGPFRLKITSGMVCVSDFCVIEEWSLHDVLSNDEKLINPMFVSFFELKNGEYEFLINGFKKDEQLGYEFVFNAVGNFDGSISLEHEFNIAQLEEEK